MRKKMKILWITNGLIKKVTNIDATIVGGEIGWVSSIVNDLLKSFEIELVYVFPQKKINENLRGSSENFKYVGFYQKESKPWKRNNEVEKQLQKLLEDEQPDIIQIWGTEYAHSLDAFAAIEKLNLQDRTLIHIQGYISFWGEKYLADVPPSVYKRKTFRDIVKHDGIIEQQKKFVKRGKNEIELLKRAKYALGRTEFDYAHVMYINSEIQYMTYNESMRPAFFEKEWSYEKCEKNTLFITQAYYPIKGFHYFIEAIGYLKKMINNIKVYVAGDSIIYQGKARIRESSYGRYVRKLMKQYEVYELFEFVGEQDEEGMANLYAKSNVFVLPSVMENSPNSLAEALVVGTPSIAADVGGVSSMVEQKRDCLMYQHNDAIMLAERMYELLTNSDKCREMSLYARTKARMRYNPSENNKVMMNIYNSVLSNQHSKRGDSVEF